MGIQWKKLIFCLALPLGAGGLSALLAGDMALTYRGLLQPPLSPPAWVFPAAWTVLYLMMGLALYRAKEGCGLFYGQLAVNAAWPPIFFRLRAFGFALLWLGLLLVLASKCALAFGRSDKWAGRLLIPYLVWLVFAGYLNWGVWILN